MYILTVGIIIVIIVIRYSKRGICDKMLNWIFNRPTFVTKVLA